MPGHWRWIAVMDFALAGFNIFMVVLMHNLASIMNIAAAIVCGALGAYALHRDAQYRASRAEEARIQQIRDNWPWN